MSSNFRKFVYPTLKVQYSDTDVIVIGNNTSCYKTDSEKFSFWKLCHSNGV